MANKANSVVVVDAGIEAPLQLAAGLAFDAEILILPYDRDGVAHIAAALQARPETTDVYVVAHGAPGQLFLGNTELSLSTLPRYGDRLRQWTATTKIKNIHFYGCRVAAGDAGTEFLSAVHALTNANIAASTHLLGHADQGGDWTLDAFWGEVERRSLLTADAISTYPGSLANDIENATPITPGGPLQDGNADADAQLGEPLHDPTGFGQDVAGQILANDSVWWSWTANIDGLVNINTIGSDIGTVLAVYSGPVNATSADFGSFSLIDTDFTAIGGATTGASVNFNAVNGVTYYFAVDGTGFQQTTGNDTGITIELDVPPVITPAQIFTIDENSAAATPLDGGGQVAVTGTVDTWAITAGNLDNDGDGNAAFAIDNTGVISVNDADDLDFEGSPNTYQLTVTASDAAGFSDSEAVFVQVKDVNEAPEITSLSALGTVNEGETVTLTGQVSDPDAGDTQKVTIDWTNDGATADDITVTVDSNGMFSASNTYADDFQGEISVTVEDAAGAVGTTDPVTRNISVLNVAPEITPSIPLNFTLAEDGSQSFFLTATDPSSVDVLTWSVGSPSNGGSLTAPVGNDATQFFTYTPDLNFNGTETFEIQVRDDDGGLDTVQFNVTVTPEADAPTGLTLSASDNNIDEGGNIILSGTFQDPDVGDEFTVTIDWGDGSTPTELTTGDLQRNGTTYSFNVAHDFLANDDVSVVVTVRDDAGLTDIASEAITINNLPPVVDPASTFLSINEDTTGTTIFNASDTTATNFTWQIIDGPDNGTVSLTSTTGTTQTLTYTPDADFFGGDNVIIEVSDGDDVTAVNVAVIVKSVNDDPTNLVFTPDDDTINEGDTVTLSGTFDDVDNSTELLIDDVHSITIDWGDGTVKTFTEADLGIFTDTDQGTVSFDNLTHTYADEGSGTYTIEVTVTDKLGATDKATREIQVSNVAPVISAPPDTTATPLAATEDTPIAFTVKATDVGVEDILVWSEIDAPDNGTLTFGSSPENGVQNVIYTPNADFNGTDTFTLQVGDGDGGFESIEYTVNVAGTNDPPTLLVGNFVVTEDQELPINRSLLDAIDDETTDPANLTFTITGPGAGSFLVNGVAATTFTLADIDNGNVSLLYENANDLGVDGLAFTVTVADDGAPSLEASQFVQIPPESFTAQNDDPVFVDQDGGTLGIQLGDINVTEDGPSVLINNSIIAATDEETADGDLSFVVSDVDGGNFLLDGSETNTFTQAEINAGRVRFINDGSTTDPSYTITVSDGQGGSATLTGGGTVTEANDAPEILFNEFTIVEDELLPITPLILNATDEDVTDGPGQLTFTITGPDADSFVDVNGVTDTVFTPAGRH
ncbi:MAG: DUF4347 domain-containing protein [Leptolyngbya sp. SIOISBB]|nr:DUF4347 domain-containing protein [Leptolyngbya sp. SIOISBB]